MAIAVLAVAVGFWRKDAVPPAAGLQEALLEHPKQKVVRKPVFDTDFDGGHYTVRPRYTYELHGLVVSMHDTTTWWNYIHKQFNDKVNVVDLCVVWGDNVSSGAYQSVSFWNTQFECNFRYRLDTPFDPSQVSNNHVITDDAGVARRLRAVRIGDQVRIRGYLADYATYRDGKQLGWRISSETRTDTGPGACEVIYVEEFDVLGAAPPLWRRVFYAGLALLALGLLWWFFLPPRLDAA